MSEDKPMHPEDASYGKGIVEGDFASAGYTVEAEWLSANRVSITARPDVIAKIIGTLKAVRDLRLGHGEDSIITSLLDDAVGRYDDALDSDPPGNDMRGRR